MRLSQNKFHFGTERARHHEIRRIFSRLQILMQHNLCCIQGCEFACDFRILRKNANAMRQIRIRMNLTLTWLTFNRIWALTAQDHIPESVRFFHKLLYFPAVLPLSRVLSETDPFFELHAFCQVTFTSVIMGFRIVKRSVKSRIFREDLFRVLIVSTSSTCKPSKTRFEVREVFIRSD